MKMKWAVDSKWKVLPIAVALFAGAHAAHADGPAFSAAEAQRAAYDLARWTRQVETAAPGYANLAALNDAEARYEWYCHAEW